MWTYKQDTGELFDAGGAHAATGYSGTPSAKNDPSKQTIPKVGPIHKGCTRSVRHSTRKITVRICVPHYAVSVYEICTCGRMHTCVTLRAAFD
jgi:hypothetical protein